MSERRTRPAGWLRSVCRAAAVLVLAGLLGAPGAGARSDSLFTVSVTPAAATPGDDVTVSFTARDENLVILSCGAALDSHSLPDCTGSGGAWSVHFTVPADAKPATTTIGWWLRYTSDPDSQLGADSTKGTVDFTVLPPVDQPQVSVVLDPVSGRVGDDVTARFSPIDPKTTITTCSLLIAGITLSDCTTTGTDWSLPFTVPGSADVGSSTVEWSVVYERGEQKRKARGTTPFTVLPPDAPPPTFTVSVSPDSTRADGTVTLRFTANDDTVGITGCSAQLEGVPLPGCVGSGGVWSIRFTVPKDVTVGPHPIAWQLTYTRETLILDSTKDAVSGETKGEVSVSVLPPVTTSTPPSGPSTTSAGPAQGGSPTQPSSTVTSGAGPTSASPEPVEPPVAEPTETALIDWVRQHSDLGLLLTLVALAALAGIVLGSRGRPARHASPDRSDEPPLGGQVRAVAHPGLLPALVLHDTGSDHRSRTVRLAAQYPPASSHLKEVT